MPELYDLMAFANELADEGGALATAAWRSDLAVSYKSDGSALTQADLAIEARWRDLIAARFPDHGVLGEEYGEDRRASAYTWVLDPIDGTRQFGAGLMNFSTLISVCRDGAPVLGVIDLPLGGARYAAAAGMGAALDGRAIRTSGREDLDDAVISLANPESFGPHSRPAFDRLAHRGRQRVYDGGSPAYGALARGLIDICLNGDDLDAFDICALCPIVAEAGGVISDWRGGALTIASKGAIVASASEGLHQATLAVLAQG